MLSVKRRNWVMIPKKKAIFGSTFHFNVCFVLFSLFSSKSWPTFNLDKLYHNEIVKILFWKIKEMTHLKWKYLFLPSCKSPGKFYKNAWVALVNCNLHISEQKYTKEKFYLSICLKCCDGSWATCLAWELRGALWLDPASNAWYWWCVLGFVRD